MVNDMSEYKELQIIKHALAYYLERPAAHLDDTIIEKALLERINTEVEELKRKYNIK
jgi:hypothetical protein